MKKYLILGLAAILLVGLVLAGKPDFQAAKIINFVKQDVKNRVSIPEKAVKVAPNIYYLGTAIDNGKVVEGYAVIHYKKGFGKPGAVCGNGVCEKGETPTKCPADCGSTQPDTSSCYGFLASGAKWKTVEPYIVNPANSRSLDELFVASNLAFDIDKWEQAATVNILGAGSLTGETLIADTISTDGKNEVYFGSIDDPGAIAITIVWGIFGGPPKSRQLVEWDQVYDQLDYDWSTAGEPGKMDFESIATHELGHTVGLDDLYTSECSEQTMYGYADYGETKKRTLEPGDINGIKTLY